ncbi:3-dehydroquinate synthase [Paralimibaculum aggregatum]|uniref:3-dehydroquinate synthase n=1 Tax=Paralimibaculum aggregatum TaxID=3036245 RepID=A0ABQ6LLS1_9RHOB|nr:3-dehydroquinate synthase [Limibaculum sp. NKW23]GMG84135.1 3-dehydroquinate synthase [Limibaculum sp. NKW23]
MPDQRSPAVRDRWETSITWQRFSVPFAYPVAFTRGLLAPENPLLAETLALREPDKRHRALVFLDAGVAEALPGLAGEIAAHAEAHAAAIELVAAPVIVPGGEAIKTELTHIEGIQDAIHAHRIDRHSYVIAIGGGAVLDAVGLAAATAHRGVRHVRIPTTVLAQNDSGVGVKNAVNLKGVKNYTGTFAPPWAVLNDLDLLHALPRRDRLSGISEAVKVALIRDPGFFAWLEANVNALATFDPAAEEHMIRRSAELHMHQIAHGGDPFETGSARPLDFGHWSAHKLEAMTRHHVRHGEAVAIGVALDARYSVLAGLLEPGQEERVAVLLEGLGLRIWHPALARPGRGGRPAVLDGLDEFREHLGGALTVTLLAGLGRGVEVNAIDPALVVQAMDWLAAREAG